MKPATPEQLRQAAREDPADAPYDAQRNFRCKRCEHRYITHGPKGCKFASCKCKAFCK